MPEPLERATRSLRIALVLRLCLALLLGVGAALFIQHRLDLVSEVTNLHAAFKLVLYVWHCVWLKLPLLLGGALLASLALVILPALRARPWKIVAASFVILSLALGGSAHRVALGVAITLLLANGLPQTAGPDGRLARVLAWIPGSLLVFPLHVLRLARLPVPSLVRAAAGTMLAALWFAADQGLCYHRYCFEMTRWVDTHRASDLEVIESVRRGEYFDYADIDLVGDRLVAVAEQTHRLLALDFEGRILDTHALPEKWMPPALGSVFDSASDAERGVTYYLGGPHHLEGLRWAEGGWAETLRSREFSIETGFAGYYLPQVRAGGPKMILRRPAHPGLLHVAMAWSPERERVFAVTIDPRKPSDYPLMVSASPDLQEVEVLNLRTAEGLLLPTPREILWVPPLDALVVAPDFWDTLYLVDPSTGIARAWLEAPLSNGNMLWVLELGRMFLSVPGELSIWVIDPVEGRLERKIPTMPGVRSLAVDPVHGLFVTATIFTGTVLVQRLDDGGVVDVFHGAMPMVRKLVLQPERGVAFLTTWSVLYRFSYLRRWEPGSGED